MQLKKKRFRDTPAFGNTIALVGIVGIIITLGVLMPRGAEAEVVAHTSAEEAAIKANIREMGCRPTFIVAETLMQSRQDGETLFTMLDSVKEAPSLEKMVNETFRVSRYEIKENQDKAVKEYAERKYLDCQDKLERLTK